ncbi:MAG: hypothetical protein QOG46_91 [Pseudonocardiales bacterium]|jgi:hypothetical protein|nr:hypothetical protein [Pseudonocardiales bacterium]
MSSVEPTPRPRSSARHKVVEKGNRTLVPNMGAQSQQRDGDGGVTHQQGDHLWAGQQPPEPCSEDCRPRCGRAVFPVERIQHLVTVAASATVATRGVRTDRCSIYASMSEVVR